jgi:ornithine carrier protein
MEWHVTRLVLFFFILTPVELIKCKMQVQMISRELDVLAKPASTATGTARALSSKAFAGLDGPVKIFLEILKREGPSGLWLGQTGTFLRETGGSTAWFLGFEWACRAMLDQKRKKSSRTDLTKKDLSSLQLMAAGALAGVSYNVILFPADSVKSTMQTDRELRGSTAQKIGFYSTFKRMYATKGIRGLYAGCAVTSLKSGPSSALIFYLYSRLEFLADEIGL